MSSPMEDIVARLAAGGQPDARDAAVLLASHDLVTLGMLADERRCRRHGRRATFVRVAEFRVEEGPPTADVPIPDAAREVRVTGAPLDVEGAVAMVRGLAPRVGRIPLTGYSLAALVDLAARAQLPVSEVAGQLRRAGLEAVAEVQVDRAGDIRTTVEACRAAGLRVDRLTVHRVDGADRLADLFGAEALQRAVGGFAVFAPLPQGDDVAEPSTGYDDIKRVALARLLVDNIASIQVSWRASGPKLAQVALTFGADDVDGISPVEGSDLGVRRAPLEEIRRNILAAALEPAERDGRFALVEP